jgi:hypothetical protein
LKKRLLINTSKGNVNYLNSGDWIENLTALEYEKNAWKIYHYSEDINVNELTDAYYVDEAAYLRTAELFKMMMEDFVIAS